MKFIISQKGIKRELDGPFAICASRKEMLNLRQCIDNWLNEPGNGIGLTYGWVIIEEQFSHVDHANVAPEPWDA